MKISSYQMQWRGMTTLYEQQSQISELQEKISKGKNFLQPSDDPYAATRSMQIRQYIGRVDQYNSNADYIKNQLETTEQSLSSYQDVLTRLNDLTLQIANDTYNDKDLKIVQQEVKELLKSTVSLANTKDTFGRSIFSGFTQGVDPVSTNASGVYEYNGDLGRRFAPIGTSTVVPQNKLAQEIFFGLPSSHVNVNTPSQLATHTVTSADLAGLTSLDINGQSVNLYNDGVSTFSNTTSAQSLYQALVAAPDLALEPRVIPASVSLGNYVSGFPVTLTGTELEINGVPIEGTVNNINDFAMIINAQTPNTGVQAQVSQSGEITLRALDGRNIDLDYKALTSTLNFNTNITGAANQVLTFGEVEITSLNDFTYDYNSAGLTNATVTNNFTASLGVKNSSELTASSNYLLYGHADGTISLFSESLDQMVLDHVDPSDGIVYSGLEINLSAPPTAETVQKFEVDRETNHDIFNAMSRFIDFLGDSTSFEKKDEVRLMLETIDSAFSKANQVIAEIGASTNLVDRQVEINKEMVLQSTQVLSSIEDLDLTKAISDFTFQKIAIEAAQSSYMQMQGMFLFKYM